MKKILALILVVSLAFCLVACNFGGKDNGDNGGNDTNNGNADGGNNNSGDTEVGGNGNLGGSDDNGKEGPIIPWDTTDWTTSN